MNAMNHLRAAKKVTRCLACTGTVTGIVGIILHPERALNHAAFMLSAFFMISTIAAVVALAVLIALRTVRKVGSSTLGPGLTAQHARFMLFFLRFPNTTAWSPDLFLLIAAGLMLSGLAVLYGRVFAPHPDAPTAQNNRRERPPAQRLQAALGQYLEGTHRPLSDYSAGEIAAHADLIGRNGRVKINRRAKTATVVAHDGYRATYRLADGTHLGGTRAA
ncbi:hypothetical protein [Arthrobacter sp. SD76]|uniref:hypothetical protein n=1 Tax=Arthrobacter sp. SD76 TaxID=3415007 RepID=UPI003C77FD57